MNNQLDPLPDLTDFKPHYFDSSSISYLFDLKSAIENIFTEKNIAKEKLKFIGVKSPIIKSVLKQFEREYLDSEVDTVLSSVKSKQPFILFHKKKWDKEDNILAMGNSMVTDCCTVCSVKIEFSEEEQFYINRWYEICNYIRVYRDKIEISLVTTELPGGF
jgi:hypothetical protein